MSDNEKSQRRSANSRTSRSDPPGSRFDPVAAEKSVQRHDRKSRGRPRETEDFKAAVVAYNEAVSQARHPAGHATPAGVLAAQLSGFRNRQELTVVGLAERCAKLGATYIDRNVITKIENNARGVSLVEAITLAAALNVSPLHLFIPLDDDATVSLAPDLRVHAPVARQWVRGQQPLPGSDDKAYRTEVPDSEWEQQRTGYDEAVEQVEAADRRVRILQMKSRQVSTDLAEVEGYGSPFKDTLNKMNNPRYRRLSAMLDLCYDELAEATVELEEARTRLDQGWPGGRPSGRPLQGLARLERVSAELRTAVQRRDAADARMRKMRADHERQGKEVDPDLWAAVELDRAHANLWVITTQSELKRLEPLLKERNEMLNEIAMIGRGEAGDGDDRADQQ